MNNNTIMELCSFSLKSGVSHDDFNSTHATTNQWMKQQPGFMSRSLCFEEEKNQWRDVIRWQSAAHACAAGKAFIEAETNQAFMQMIDEESLNMEHIPVTMEIAA